MTRSTLRLLACAAIALAAFAPAAGVAQADGGPSNALLIIDPTDADSLYLGHVYATRRSIPASNVLYLPPAADDYASWAAFQRHAVTGTLAARGLAHVDHIVIAPGTRFYMPMAPNRVRTGCGVVSRMSLSSAYTFLPQADEILGGTLTDQDLNRYRAEWRRPSDATAFDSQIRWYNGRPATSGGARRYFIGTLLGYLGERGNTVDEVAAMIERSAAVDGTRPDGTFYFMNVAGEVRNYRSADFPAVINAISAMGGKAEAIDGLVPGGRHDALGILTGTTNPAIVGADVTIKPGAFADHLTSFAATFDTGSQEKMSSWITAGASATLGTVQEPCTGGKFPDAALHAYSFAGLPLGEAIFRSVQWSAFQSLFLGDPLTRAFTHIPSLTVDGVPRDVGSIGQFPLTARAVTEAPGAAIAGYTLLIDGIPAGSSTDGRFVLNTSVHANGRHEVRVTAVDDTAMRAVGEWTSEWTVKENDRWLSVDTTVVAVGGRPRSVDVDVRMGGGLPVEVRLLQNGRLIAAAAPLTTTTAVRFTLPIAQLGMGPSALTAIADYADGSSTVSAPAHLDPDRDPAGPPPPDAPPADPNAFNHTLDARPGRPLLLDLPGSAPDGGAVTIVVTSPPAQANVRTSGSATLLWPRASAAGTDTLTYSVKNTIGTTATGIVTIHYCPAGAPNVPVAPGFPDPCRRWTPPPTPTLGPSATPTPPPTATRTPGQRAFLPVAFRLTGR